jgi:hypothetical protein
VAPSPTPFPEFPEPRGIRPGELIVFVSPDRRKAPTTEFRIDFRVEFSREFTTG